MFYFALASLATLVYCIYELKTKNQVKIYTKNEELLKKCPSLKQYNPPMFMCGFLHTALSLFLPKLNFRSIRETIQGGIILDWVDLPKEKENKYPRVLVVLLPGLTGGLKDKYIQQLVDECFRVGFGNVCVYNQRLLNSNPDFNFVPPLQNHNLNMKPIEFEKDYVNQKYMGIDPDFYFYEEGRKSRVDLVADLHYSMNHIKQSGKYDKILAIGCSYGGIQLANYLGRFHDICLIDGGVGVSISYSMIIAIKRITFLMDQMIRRILQRKFGQLNSKSFPVEWNVNFDKAIKAKTTWEFDDELACHVYGYKNADCYYRHFSPINNLINIMVPYLGIQSLDDGVCHRKSIARQEILLNEKAILCITKRGGHVGYLEGWNLKKTWFAKASVEFLQGII